MQFKDSGKTKAVTFSFDDGVTQDVRMVQLLNKYGLKATFFINSGRIGNPGISVRGHACYRLAEKHLVDTYAGHEVASHTIGHVDLPSCDDAEVIRQVEEDRVKLSEIMGYEILGLAYPGDPKGRENYDERCIDLIRKYTGIRYARTVGCGNRDWALPTDLYMIRPNMSMRAFDESLEIVERFISANPTEPQVLHLMGHCYEMDFASENWYRMEQVLEKLSGRDDIFYGTNKEVYL